VTSPLLPGATLGVLGGGQLGRMFVHAAQRMGYGTAVLDADPDSPAGLVAHHHVRTGYTDAAGLTRLLSLSSAVTTEFENVPARSLQTLAEAVRVAPSATSVEVAQHRAREKAFFGKAGVPCAPHALIEHEVQLAAVDAALLPGILKTAQLGYDGKGQAVVATRAELAAAWTAMGRVPCVLEQKLALAVELSVVVARGADGAVVTLPVQQNLHRGGILAVTQVPAPDVPDATQREATDAARAIARAIDYVGVLCVEFFVLADGRLVANEMAPRPHNSGHHSIEACDVSQFELQVRTLAGLPLAPPRLLCPAVMLNLLGDLWPGSGTAAFAAAGGQPDWARVLALPGAHLHLYGKREARQGRKMGHLTITGATAADVRSTALQAAAILGIEPF
jgi:5-(carboxyamino)imidazole ribonucleotide synthase